MAARNGLAQRNSGSEGERTPIAIVRQSTPAKVPQNATRIEPAQQNGERGKCGNRFKRRVTRVATRIDGLAQKDGGSEWLR